jgi:uncharacterized protein (TIGR03435 family)
MRVAALWTFALAMALPSFAQTPASLPSFDVASVKALPDASGLPDKFSYSPRRSGGRITWAPTLYMLSMYAYHLPAWRISGTDKDHTFYAIEATMDASSSEDKVRLMYQKLLADRFKLAVHRETKEAQGYALVFSKNGPKVKAAAGPGESHPMPEYLSGKPSAALEGRIMVTAEGVGTMALTGRGVSSSQLAETLSDTLGTFVLDQTGLTGKYYFGFKFLAVNSPPRQGVEASSIFAALEDELGLKLEKQKGPVEIVIVDHVEKPSDN